MTPADDYRAVVTGLTEALDADTVRGEARIRELRTVVAELGWRLAEAADQHTVARVGNILAWEDALEILWVEQWMTLRPFPRPDRLADPGAAVDAVAEVEAGVAALRAQVQHRGLRLPRR